MALLFFENTRIEKRSGIEHATPETWKKSTIGLGSPSLAPEYSSAVALLAVVLMKPNSMYPRQPLPSVFQNDGGRSARPPSPLYSSRLSGSLVTRAILMTAEARVAIVVGNRFPPSLYALYSSGGGAGESCCTPAR